jgi:N-acetylmuramoyl-L-alanine amidase
MKLPALLAVVVVLAAGPSRAASGQPSAGAVRLAGHDYVRITDWAHANGFEAHWLRKDESLQLTGHAVRILLTVDSRESQINGLHVWLSFPVLGRGGIVYLALSDAESTLRPLVFRPKNKPGTRLSSICLDPGHGGKDPGNCVGPNQEKKYTLLLAREVSDQLERAGIKTTLTRNSDSFVELEARPELAQRRRADLFVSLHFNSTEIGRSTVQGTQVYCLTPVGASSTNARGEGGGAGMFPGNRNNDKNLFLAYEVQRNLVRNLGLEDLGVRRARFAVLREASMPAILIESGFMSHPVEGRKIFSAAYRKQLAQSIVEGLLAYKHAIDQG